MFCLLSKVRGIRSLNFLLIICISGTRVKFEAVVQSCNRCLVKTAMRAHVAIQTTEQNGNVALQSS